MHYIGIIFSQKIIKNVTKKPLTAFIREIQNRLPFTRLTSFDFVTFEYRQLSFYKKKSTAYRCFCSSANPRPRPPIFWIIIPNIKTHDTIWLPVSSLQLTYIHIYWHSERHLNARDKYHNAPCPQYLAEKIKLKTYSTWVQIHWQVAIDHCHGNQNSISCKQTVRVMSVIQK
jgi:hypothetical protein